MGPTTTTRSLISQPVVVQYYSDGSSNVPLQLFIPEFLLGYFIERSFMADIIVVLVTSEVTATLVFGYIRNRDSIP